MEEKNLFALIKEVKRVREKLGIKEGDGPVFLSERHINWPDKMSFPEILSVYKKTGVMAFREIGIKNS